MNELLHNRILERYSPGVITILVHQLRPDYHLIDLFRKWIKVRLNGIEISGDESFANQTKNLSKRAHKVTWSMGGNFARAYTRSLIESVVDFRNMCIRDNFTHIMIVPIQSELYSTLNLNPRYLRHDITDINLTMGVNTQGTGLEFSELTVKPDHTYTVNSYSDSMIDIHLDRILES